MTKSGFAKLPFGISHDGNMEDTDK